MNLFTLKQNVKFQAAVNVNLSANQWELDTENHSRHTIESVANYLNRRFNDGYNRGMNRSKLETFVSELMKQFELYGANNLLPRRKLIELLDMVYPEARAA